MKTLITSSVLIFVMVLSGGINAQIPVTWTDPEPLDDEFSRLEAHQLPDGRFYTIETRQFFNLSVRVTLYDANKKKIDTKALKFPKQDKMWGVAGVLHEYIELKGKHYFITDEPSPGKGSISLLAWEFSPETLTIGKEPLVLSKSKGAGMFRQGRFHYLFNGDHSRLYVVEMPGQEKDENEAWIIREFDGELNMVNERNVDLPFEASKFHVTRVDIDSRGNLVFGCMLYEKGGPLAQIFSVSYTHIYAIVNAGSSEVRTVPISFEDKVPHHISHMLDDEGGGVYIFGFYSKKSLDQAEGIFECNMSLDAELTNKKLHPFPNEVVSSLQRISGSRTKSEAQFLTMRSVMKNSDGSRQFIAEQMLVEQITYIYDYNISNTDTRFTSRDILVIKLYPDESMNWYSWIPKKQFSLNDGGRFLSFSYQYTPAGTLQIIYNDSPANLTRTGEEPEKMDNKEFCTVLAAISPDGEVGKTKLFDTGEVGHRLVVRNVRFDGDRAFLLAVAKKTFRQGVLDLRAIN